jgi:predicted MFS family arabinose efflux permease
MGIVSPEQRGLASAVNSIIWRLPNSVTTVFGGQLMDAGLLDVPIFLATVFYAAFVMGFYAVFRKVSPST